MMEMLSNTQRGPSKTNEFDAFGIGIQQSISPYNSIFSE